MMKSIPNLSQCYAMLLQEERQREVTPTSHMNFGNVAMNAKSYSGNRFLQNRSENSSRFTQELGGM